MPGPFLPVTPEEVAANKDSFTGQYLAKMLGK